MGGGGGCGVIGGCGGRRRRVRGDRWVWEEGGVG